MNNEEIAQAFREAFDKDKNTYISSWIADWKYQRKRKNRGVVYEADNVVEDYYSFSNPKDIIRWWNWASESDKPGFFNHDQIRELAELSLKFDAAISEKYSFNYDFTDYLENLGKYNAQDYFIANLKLHEEPDPLAILDFGAGYGRQINLWSQLKNDVTYVGMDAIELSYCLQYFYYLESGLEVHDYIESPDTFKITPKGGIFHLPTWRYDLLPDSFFDRIFCIHVFQELNPKLVKKAIKFFKRVLKPSGSLYIRDNEFWQPAHSLNIEKILEEEGFVLEYKPHVVHKVDIHGIPRIWRKKNPDVLTHRDRSFKYEFRKLLLDIDSLTKGRLKKIIRKN